MKKNSVKKTAVAEVVTVDQKVTRNIGKTPELRNIKIAAYINAAVYNAKKVNNTGLAEKLEKLLPLIK